MILALGTYDASRHPRIGIIMEGLRAHGYQIEEVNKPLHLTTAQRVKMLQQPWRLPLLAFRLLACWWALAVGALKVRRTLGRPQAVLVGYMGHFDVLLARMLFPRTTIVLDHLIFAADTATDRGARGLKVRILSLLDRLATAAASLVVTDTDEHLAMLAKPSTGVTVLVGAPHAWFEAGERAAGAVGFDGAGGVGLAGGDGVDGPGGQERPVGAGVGEPHADGQGADGPRAGEPLTVVFFGLYTPLQGAAVIGQAIADVLDAGAHVQFTMIGQGQDYARTRELVGPRPQVTWKPWVEPEQLPDIVAGHQVCLGIFSDTPKGLRVVPNKVYQGLAAGCLVVTSDTRPQRRSLGQAVIGVPPADSQALADAIRDLARMCAEQGSEWTQARKRAWAGRDHIRPQIVVEPLLERLAGVR